MTSRELLASLFDAWRNADALRAVAHFKADAVYHEARHKPRVGREALADAFTCFFRDGPAWRFEVEDIIVEGERAVVDFRFFLEGQAGVWHERAGCALIKFADGLIAEWREYEG